jgi:uncharacterized membrane protein
MRIKLKLNKWIISLFSAVLLIISLGNKVQAEEIKLTSDIINAEITKDGSMLVSEELNFKISGKYNGVYKDISFDKAEGISDITVAEYKGNSVLYKEVKSASNGNSGVYILEKKSNSVRVKIYSPSKDEVKTFRVTYKITGAVKKYNDIGELYWKFIGKENETSIDKLQINLMLPEGARKEEMKVFGHGPLDGSWRIADRGLISFSASSLSSKQYVEVRTIFPKELLSDVKTSINENKFDSIIAEENSYINDKAEKAKDRERLIGATKNIAILMSLASILVIIYIFISRKRYSDIEDLTVMKDIRNYNPALLAYNAKRSLSHNDLLAAVFDLVRKGYLSIDIVDDNKYKITKLREKDESLLKHEGYLMHWLINKIGDGKSVTLKQIKKHAEKNPGEFTRRFSLWIGEVKLKADESNIFDKRAAAFQVCVIIFEIILVAASIFFIIIGNMYGAISFAAASLVIITAALINTRTLEGNIQCALWNKMKKNIKSLSAAETEQWESNPAQGEIYLIYAIAMNLRQDLVEKISPHMNIDNYYNKSSFWMLYYMMNNNYHQFNDSFNVPSQNTETSGSFSSGDSSGGFSSGGGGGAGGF